MTPGLAAEFPRPVRLDTLGATPHRLAIDADAAECAALAARFALVRIDRLHAEAALTRDGDVVTAQGRLEADVVQACVATGADVAQAVAEPFTVRFVPEIADAGDEVELEAGELDTVTYAGSAVDLGEAAAQTLMLALDPFPRAPDAEAALRAAGVRTDDQVAEPAGPFAQLLSLKDRLNR